MTSSRCMKIAALVAILALCLSAALAWAGEVGTVTSVIDGNTIKVRIGAKTETVRLIGVDTEFIHPQKPIGDIEDRLLGGFLLAEEASAFTRRMSLGERVLLLYDPWKSNRDGWGRLVRYVYLPNGKLLNAEIIREGHGTATRGRFERLEEFRRLERDARENGRGLWAK